jgi:nicotinamidase-related amidase
VELNVQRTALLLMDYQPDLFAFIDEPDSVIDLAARLRDIAREAGIPVIYIVVRFRDGYPEVSPRNKSFWSLKDVGILRETEASSFVHERLAPGEGELVITKRRVSAFAGSDLAVALTSIDADTLILAGINTSGVILSTTREAADLDFRLVIAADACADPDPELHTVLLEKVLVTQAEILSVDGVRAALEVASTA